MQPISWVVVHALTRSPGQLHRWQKFCLVGCSLFALLSTAEIGQYISCCSSTPHVWHSHLLQNWAFYPTWTWGCEEEWNQKNSQKHQEDVQSETVLANPASDLISSEVWLAGTVSVPLLWFFWGLVCWWAMCMRRGSSARLNMHFWFETTAQLRAGNEQAACRVISNV